MHLNRKLFGKIPTLLVQAYLLFGLVVSVSILAEGLVENYCSSSGKFFKFAQKTIQDHSQILTFQIFVCSHFSYT